MATGARTPTLYKGAGPGSHWHVNQPSSRSGFSIGLAPGGPNAILRHITRYSAPSPYLSFTTSFAIARHYALSGPAGVASATAPGFVYEVDLSALSVAPKLVDPVAEIAALGNGFFSHKHDGSPNLILEVATGKLALGQISQAHQTGGLFLTPSVSQELNALIFAIRDAEVLVAGNVLAGAVVNVHPVF